MSITIIKSLIIVAPDFLQSGIFFLDITPLLADAYALSLMVSLMVQRIKEKGLKPTIIAGPESCGFIFVAVLFKHLFISFVQICLPNKPLSALYTCEYNLEYGTASACIELYDLKGHDEITKDIFIDSLVKHD